MPVEFLCKLPARRDQHLGDRNLDEKIECAATTTAQRVMAHQVTTYETIFSQCRDSCYQASD